jgi:hypothetical protein
MIEQHGLVTAATFGVVWRHCQMKDRVCYAAIETLAKEIGVNRRTIERHLKLLCQQKYLHRVRRPGTTDVYQVIKMPVMEQEISIRDTTESHNTQGRESYEETNKDTITTDCPSDNTPAAGVDDEEVEVNELEPRSEKDLMLFNAINGERKIKGWRRISCFPSSACAVRYRNCSAQLDITELGEYIQCALQQGVIALPKVVGYIEGCAKRRGQPRQSGNGRRPSNLQKTMANAQRALAQLGET